MRVKVSAVQKLKLWFRTLFSHTSFSWEYCMDTMVEPLFWFVDKFVVMLGRFFVCMVVFLIGSITTVGHLIGIPIYWGYSPTLTALLFLVGYWILINISFNFYKGVSTHPGSPTDLNLIPFRVAVCKKCISPKPPRTHHCSICNRCKLNSTVALIKANERMNRRIVNKGNVSS